MQALFLLKLLYCSSASTETKTFKLGPASLVLELSSLCLLATDFTGFSFFTFFFFFFLHKRQLPNNPNTEQEAPLLESTIYPQYNQTTKSRPNLKHLCKQSNQQ